MAQQSEVETLDSSSSSSNGHSSDPSLSRNSSFSSLNALAPEFVPTRNPPPTQSKQPSRVVMSPPPPPPPPPTASPNQVYSPHGTGAFHVIPVHNQIHHQHHVPVQNYHLHQLNHWNNHHHHHRHQNHNHHGSNSNHQYGDQRTGEISVVDDKKEKKDHQHGGLNAESIQKVLNQVEYYFSDLNLATTDHLIRFILKDPEGYVPISTVSSFKKIKAVISGHSQLASVLRKSSKLFVSDDGKKVKRQNPLTESDLEELQSRIIIAENLPEDHCHQNLMKIFSAVGSVKTIRTCLPQTSGGGASSTSRSAKGDGMLFSNKLHAFVEYESFELAEKAISELNDGDNWSGLRVRLMLKRGSKTAQVKSKKGHEGGCQYEEEDTSTSKQHLDEKHPDDPSQQSDVHSHENTGEEHYNEKEGGRRKGRNKGRGKGRGWNDRGQCQHNTHHNNGGYHVGTPPSNSMVNNEPVIGKQPPGPRMPDGTRGFTMGRGKPVAASTA